MHQRRHFRPVAVAMATLVAAMSISAGSAGAVAPTVGPTGSSDQLPTGWHLAWSDEFNGPDGSAADPAKWAQETGWGQWGWGNNELETYTPGTHNGWQQGGNLVIQTRRETYTGPDGVTKDYTSARLRTKGNYQFQYGRVEARIKLPAGTGLWPAFWMLGAGFPNVGWPQSGEADVMENKGSFPHRLWGTLHGPGYYGDNGMSTQYDVPGAPLSDGFHTYAVDWLPGRVDWSVDGVRYATKTPADMPPGSTWVFEQPFYLMLNVAVGGHFAGDPAPDTVFPQTTLVDYVRVYQPDQLPVPTGPAPYAGYVPRLPGYVQAEAYDAGGQGVGYSSSTTVNAGGAMRPNDGVGIGAPNDNGPALAVGWTRPGDWLRYTVSVAGTGTYALTARVASAGAGGRYHVEFDGHDITGPLTVPDTGAWDSWQSTTTNVALTAGQHALRVVFDANGPTGAVGNLDYLLFTSAGPPVPSPTPSPTPAPGPSPTPGPTPSPGPTPTPSPTSVGGLLYLRSGGGLTPTPGSGAASDTVLGAGGGSWPAPHDPTVYTVTGVTGTVPAGAPATTFRIYTDPGACAGASVQAQIRYRLSGSGGWDRTEVSAPLRLAGTTGWQVLTDATGGGLISTSGTPLAGARFSGGQIEVAVWSPAGSCQLALRTDAPVGDPAQSRLTVAVS